MVFRESVELLGDSGNDPFFLRQTQKCAAWWESRNSEPWDAWAATILMPVTS